MNKKIISILSDHLENPPDEFTPDMRLQADLGLTSLELVQIVCEVEDEIGIAVPDERIKDIVTIRDILDCILEMNEG